MKKELEILQKMLDNPMQEHIVRVYDKKTKEINVHRLDVKRGYLNGNISWSLFFHKHDGQIFESIDKYLLFYALNEIRKELEKEGKLIVVRGADRDATFSGMQADMTAGASTSKMEMIDRMNRGEIFDPMKYTFDVLEDSRIECVTTLAEQDEYHEKWLLNRKNNFINKDMKTVWKFELKMEVLQDISMPIDATILSVGVIKNVAYLWAAVSGDVSKTREVKILTVPTGSEIYKKAEFIGTLLYKDGEIVQHVFKITNE